MFSRKLIAVLACAAVMLVCTQSFARWNRGSFRQHKQSDQSSQSCQGCKQESSDSKSSLFQKFGERRTERKEARKSAQVDPWLTKKVFADTQSPPKLVALLFGDKSTCKWCVVMKKTMSKDKVQTRLKDEGITLVDCDHSEAPQKLFQQCDISSIPVLIIGELDDKGKLTIVKRVDQALSESALLKFMELPKETKAMSTEVGG